ncbi:hypothetical protein P7K49_003328 [Saguinus oedipus]|uniref:Uncharacterized protein n=1 Tax=Saguinus oedipus TaxID=9490 RepID=A0ABQ9WNX9_SAGOE|nr:hypothetical protein P7K49_003328 [Saguinus oedipus]
MVAEMWIAVQDPREEVGRNQAWLLEGGRRQRLKDLTQTGGVCQDVVGQIPGRVGEAEEEGMPGSGTGGIQRQGQRLQALAACPVLGEQCGHPPRNGPAEGSPSLLKSREPQEHWALDLGPRMPEVGQLCPRNQNPQKEV